MPLIGYARVSTEDQPPCPRARPWHPRAAPRATKSRPRAAIARAPFWPAYWVRS